MKLIPPDPKQCQALKPSGNTFMTLGGMPGHVRCTNKPTVIVTEKKKPHGSMSLCPDCLIVCENRMGGTFTVKTIVKTKGAK